MFDPPSLTCPYDPDRSEVFLHHGGLEDATGRYAAQRQGGDPAACLSCSGAANSISKVFPMRSPSLLTASHNDADVSQLLDTVSIAPQRIDIECFGSYPSPDR